MKNSKYDNGFKTAALILQMVFLITVIVICSLLSNLFQRSMLSFRDIGNDSFFHSCYYMETVMSELKELSFYLQLQQEPDSKKKNDELYKQYKLKYDNGNSNLFYWFFYGEKVYSNMDGNLNRKKAAAYAKKMGSYLYYDDTKISFQGNIHPFHKGFSMDILRLFGQSHGGGFILAIDQSLPYDDAIKDASYIYDAWHPWVKFGILTAIFSLICFIADMIYITIATGRSGSDNRIHLYRIDYLPTELLFFSFAAFVIGLIAFCSRLDNLLFDISSSLILTGTLVFLSDAVFLTLYLSMIRKIKADIFVSCSFSSRGMRILKESLRRQKILNRTILWFLSCVAASLFFSWAYFAQGNGWGAAGLLGIFAFLAFGLLHQALQKKRILEGILEIGSGRLDFQFNNLDFNGDYREIAEKLNSIGEGLFRAVEENVKNERLKTELITNVSHDIKTPLTSIINYINLIKMEGIKNEKLENYVGILEMKSQRLKQLTEDLVEVSKITSGTITLDMQPINMVELIYQTGGEFNEIFEDLGLTIVTRLPKEPVMILADSNRIWRIVQNLYNNAAKYALKDTRVYVELKEADGMAEFSIKDVSAHEIVKTAQDLSERFVRGDESRGTEGSGLGLSIARNLTHMMGGTFEILLNGDLFTASITFPVINP